VLRGALLVYVTAETRTFFPPSQPFGDAPLPVALLYPSASRPRFLGFFFFRLSRQARATVEKSPFLSSVFFPSEEIGASDPRSSRCPRFFFRGSTPLLSFLEKRVLKRMTASLLDVLFAKLSRPFPSVTLWMRCPPRKGLLYPEGRERRLVCRSFSEIWYLFSSGG